MLRILFLLFITLPLLELWVLIEVGSGIGGLNTILLCLLTAAIGGLLIRWQGITTLLDARKRMAHGEIPVDHGLHGLMIALSGLLLFTPGFITDCIGFLLLFPPFRKILIAQIPLQPIQPAPRHPYHDDVIEAKIITHEEPPR